VLRKILMLTIVSTLIITLIGCGGQKENKNAEEISGEVAAIVNGDKIMKSEYDKTWEQASMQYTQQGMDLESEENKEMTEMIKQNILDNLVIQKIIEQEVNKKNYKVSDEEVTAEFEKLKSQFASDEEYQWALEEANLTEDKLMEDIAGFLRTNKYLDEMIGEVEVTDEEVQELYNMRVEQEPETPAFDEIEAEVKQSAIQQKKQEKEHELIEGLKNESEIEILI
jgi:FKBP-type peptidyl-prolyl cis-trans isomerase (trigger factor)